MNRLSNKDDWFFIKNIIIFYLVGIIGFSINYTHMLFTYLSPIILILTLCLLFYYDRKATDRKRIIFFSFVFISSYIIEMIGVNTGLLFGKYQYHHGLGIKLFETPILIGINWILMIYITSSIFTKLKYGFISQIIIPSSLMLIYDIIMERAAPKMEMWSWADNIIPIQNFLMWGLLAFVFHSIRYFLKIEIKNKMALPIYLAQIILFIFIILIRH
ncbi:MAG: carotenoid biosynthesis protein [Bacteroidales bacterium]|nr:carotenoid biosynthesis protein [Bacteroidales bacterium]MDD4703148.1 carotenoid biosynthesis protein [Bacteroidales bacterium]MDX9797628.1 carotenoid biosynthesis protein [Bacteroidales bacterium]